MTTSSPPARGVRNQPRRIACVYHRDHRPNLALSSMAEIRFFRMAEALARRGHAVDLVLNRHHQPRMLDHNLREVPFKLVRWEQYDAVKTFFHRGFETLVAEGGDDHPFIISKLGSVVGREETPGVHFHGAVRERLYAAQTEIARRSKVVTVLTNRSAALWWKEHGTCSRLLQVPTGVDAKIPPPDRNPYACLGVKSPIAIFAGNIYSREHQPEVNLLWQEHLNRLGRSLAQRGISLVAMGDGEIDHLDPAAITHVGRIEANDYWDWQYHAQVGIVLAQGPVQDNESSKIYYYLRTGLPTVCEESIPNKSLIEETGCGAIVPYGDIEAMAAAAAQLVAAPRNQNEVAEYMVLQHSWDARAALYEQVLSAEGRPARMPL